MSALEPFSFDGNDVRVVLKDGEPWFVAADVCEVLGYSRVANALRMLDDPDDLGTHLVSRDDGREGPAQVISEAAVYTLVLRSERPEARTFKRWVTHDVLPTIRRTGSYGTERPRLPGSYSEALRELAAEVDRRAVAEAARDALAPSAHAWESMASADGDMSVGDAAKALSRDRKAILGQQRLFELLAEWNWIFRREGAWKPYQRYVERGWLAERARTYRDPNGVEKVAAAQVRIPLRGLQEIQKRIAAEEASA